MDNKTPMRAIRSKCLDCCLNSAAEVRMCPVRDCALYPYRFGHNPNRKGIGNSKRLETARLAE